MLNSSPTTIGIKLPSECNPHRDWLIHNTHCDWLLLQSLKDEVTDNSSVIHVHPRTECVEYSGYPDSHPILEWKTRLRKCAEKSICAVTVKLQKSF